MSDGDDGRNHDDEDDAGEDDFVTGNKRGKGKSWEKSQKRGNRTNYQRWSEKEMKTEKVFRKKFQSDKITAPTS